VPREKRLVKINKTFWLCQSEFGYINQNSSRFNQKILSFFLIRIPFNSIKHFVIVIVSSNLKLVYTEKHDIVSTVLIENNLGDLYNNSINETNIY